MLAPIRISAAQQAWNASHGSPFGLGIYLSEQHIEVLSRKLLVSEMLTTYGPFVFQRNNSTRYFEFPWCSEMIDAAKPNKLVEIGGGVSGMQFVLSQSGYQVTNIDPGINGFETSPELHAQMNEELRTSVELVPDRICNANIEAESVDLVLCISTIEHLTDDELREVLDETRRILTPTGILLLTVDLFLNLDPFTDRHSNRFGRNVPIATYLESHGFRIAPADADQTFGSVAFDPMAVMRNLSSFMIGATYPALSQALVAQPA